MRLLSILFLITVSAGAKKRRTDKTTSKTNDDLRSNMDLAKKVDLYPDRFIHPVPFGHIYREGVEDPQNEFKQPLDLMELDTIYLKDGPFARELIERREKNYQRVQNNQGRRYLSPKDAVLDGQKVLEETSAEKNDSRHSFWNLAATQRKNLHDPPKYKIGGGKTPRRPLADIGPAYKGKANYFAKGSYGLETDSPARKINSTTCDEFGKNAKFHPNDIVNLDWVPFYIWTYELFGRLTVARVHKFTYPTKKLVVKYKDEFGSFLNKTIDWEQPKLLLREDTTEMLLIAADRRGLFDTIPYQDIPAGMKNKGVQVPMSKLRLKIVDPYLAMMHCDLQYATIMAVSGSEPRTQSESISEAATLKLRGPGFPVKRDLEMEKMEARAKMMEELEKERGRNIEA